MSIVTRQLVNACKTETEFFDLLDKAHGKDWIASTNQPEGRSEVSTFRKHTVRHNGKRKQTRAPWGCVVYDVKHLSFF